MNRLIRSSKRGDLYNDGLLGRQIGQHTWAGYSARDAALHREHQHVGARSDENGTVPRRRRRRRQLCDGRAMSWRSRAGRGSESFYPRGHGALARRGSGLRSGERILLGVSADCYFSPQERRPEPR